MMAAREHNDTAQGDKPGIPTRDGDGEEHRLFVSDHPAGLVSISDDVFMRLLAPRDAILLAVDLITAATRGMPVLLSTAH